MSGINKKFPQTITKNIASKGTVIDTNFIFCNEKCRHQQDGYCQLEGGAQVTNALASPCCYFEDLTKEVEYGDRSSADQQAL